MEVNPDPEAPQQDAAPDLSEQYEQVRGLMATERMEEAGNQIGALLRDYPRDAGAHALMGELYAARQLWREAVDWFSLAESLGAGPEVSQQRAAAQAELAPPAAPRAEPPPGSELERQRTRLLAIFGAAAAVVIVTVVLALLALSGRPPEPDRRPRMPTPSPGARTYPSTGPGAAPTTPELRPPAGPQRPTQPAPTAPGAQRAQPQPGAPGARLPVVITQELAAPMTDEDYLIVEALSSLTWPDGTSLAGDVMVAMDPWAGYCLITLRIPPSLPGSTLADTVVEQAYRVSLAALTADAAIHSLTVRVIASVTGPEDRRMALVVFRGNTTRHSLEYWSKARARLSSQQLREEIFADVWWNPAVPTDRLR